MIHNAVRPVPPDPGAVRRLRAELGVGDTGSLIVAAGRLSKEKAHAVLLSAFAQPPLAGNLHSILVIVGDGPERPALQVLAARLGVAHRVRLVGRTPAPWPYHHAADAVALPSDSEGSPNALLEAMAAGKPVVATRVGGVPEIIEHGVTGILVPPRSPLAMARALSDVLRLTGLSGTLGARARDVAHERFSIGRRAAHVASIYQELCAGTSS